MATIMTKLLSASTISGDDVKNPSGENLGHIKDLMIDTESGRIAYAVLSFGGLFGMGEKLFAIPFKALRIRPDDEAFELDVDKERLERSHGFNKNDWPDMADQRWQTEVHTVYGVDPYWI
jgi:sporulation protein YlmC with PRC-barrel domain